MTDQNPLDAFIFDLGKVIVDWNPRYLLHEIVPDEDRLEVLVEEVLDLEWFRAIDAGYPLSKAIAERSAMYPDFADEMNVYVERWPETIRGLYEGTLDIVRELRRCDFPLYVLSNWARETWAMVEQDFAFLELFDDIIISGHVGVAKPDRAIFEMAEQRFNVNPATTLFIDDGPHNVAAAQTAGFQALVFTTPERLRQDLQPFNVL